MKNAKYFYLIFLLTIQFSCSNSASDTKNQTSTPPPISEETNNPESANEPATSYFVTAESGLNFRTVPKGEVLGKLLHNTELKIKERTGIFEEIKDGDLQIKGEWVGVEIDKKTVYLFSGFLSTQKGNEAALQEAYFNQTSIGVSDLKIYEIEGQENMGKNTTSFISLSDGCALSNHPDSIVISNKYLGRKKVPKIHTLNEKFRSRFLNRLQVEESDNIFVYNYLLDTLLIYPVRQTPLNARENIYGIPETVSQYDYHIGFEIEDEFAAKHSYKHHRNALVYVGKENPFELGNATPIVWEKMDTKQFPFLDKTPQNRQLLRNYKIHDSFKFKHNERTYFLQRYGNRMTQYLTVFSRDNQLVYDKIFMDSEGTTPAELTIVDQNKPNQPYQFTGKIFKNHPPVIFGFEYHSFGCPGIDLLELPARSIPILCDNRH